MLNKTAKIKFYFPESSHEFKNKQEFVNLIVEDMQKDGGMKYSGYLKEDDLKKDLLRHYGSGEIAFLKLSAEHKKTISETIYEAAEKCQQVLPHPNPPIFVFVYPWSTNAESQTLFRGVTAFAEYYTIHLFVDLEIYTKASLEQTIVHEWNHLVYYRYHSDFPYTLLAYITMEGFAEVFREETVAGDPAPWSLALSEDESLKKMKLLEKHFDTKGMKMYREIFFGNKEFKKWTGYSVGYRLVKEFRKKHPKLSWEQILQLDPKEILK